MPVRGHGIPGVKMKVGRLWLNEESSHQSGARSIVPDILLMLDANMRGRRADSSALYERYEPYAPYWIEEPFSPDEIDSHARLAQRTHVPVATARSRPALSFQGILDNEAAAVLQTDAAVCGGIGEFRRIAALAASYGVMIAALVPLSSYPLVASIPKRTVRGYFRTTGF
jgi:L-alanine-DL-glutamate epimerase-like enolase superfamily enzyme